MFTMMIAHLPKRLAYQVADARVVGRSPHPNTASGLRGVSDAFLDEETSRDSRSAK